MLREARTAIAEDVATGLRPCERNGLHLAFAGLVFAVGLSVLHAAVGFGGVVVDGFVRTWGSSAVYVLAAAVVVLRAIRGPRQRAAWAIVAVGLSLYAAGNVVWSVFYDGLAEPPIPSVSDALWLSLYPASYLGLVLLAREDKGVITAGVWLDGVVAGLGVATLGAAVVFGPVFASAGGDATAVATNLAYPVCDLLLGALVVGLMALRGWHIDRVWGFLGGGFLLLCVADSLYLLRVAAGAEQVSVVPNVFYMAGVVGLAYAAWQPHGMPVQVQVERWSAVAVPTFLVVTALGVLVADRFVTLSSPAVALAMLTLLAAILRMGLTFRDVRALAVTRRQALTDDLTALPNRRQFLRHVDMALDGARQGAGSVAVLILDLDRFKTVNDTLGHHAGDLLLTKIGPRVGGVLRRDDMLARLGGDEFGIVLSGPCDRATALGIADRTLEALRRPFEIEHLALHATASIGIAMFPEHADDARALLRHADVAMYQAKLAHSGRELYARDRDTNTRDRLALASELPDAIARTELEVHFQPKAETASGDIVGMEALVRWRHPQRGMLAPNVFVGLAEQGGMMRELTRTVLAGALSECRRWRDAGYGVPVAVNVSFSDLCDAEFALEVSTALAHHGVEADALTIEVTESSIMSDATRVGDVLARLSELGVRISLDDFGTGYSSLSHLRTLPVREVKVDRSFVATMCEDEMNATIVRSTVQLAHNLGLRVVAEGVEDHATRTALDVLGCDLIQGYYLSRPLPPDQAALFLADHVTSTTIPAGERPLQ